MRRYWRSNRRPGISSDTSSDSWAKMRLVSGVPCPRTACEVAPGQGSYSCTISIPTHDALSRNRFQPHNANALVVRSIQKPKTNSSKLALTGGNPP